MTTKQNVGELLLLVFVQRVANDGEVTSNELKYLGSLYAIANPHVPPTGRSRGAGGRGRGLRRMVGSSDDIPTSGKRADEDAPPDCITSNFITGGG